MFKALQEALQITGTDVEDILYEFDALDYYNLEELSEAAFLNGEFDDEDAFIEELETRIELDAVLYEEDELPEIDAEIKQIDAEDDDEEEEIVVASALQDEDEEELVM